MWHSVYVKTLIIIYQIFMLGKQGVTPSPPQPSQPFIPKRKRKPVVRKLKIASEEEEDEDVVVQKALQLAKKLKYLVRF